MKITKSQLRSLIKEEVNKLTESFAKGEVKKINSDIMDKWNMRRIEHADETKYDLMQRVREEGYEIVSGLLCVARKTRALFSVARNANAWWSTTFPTIRAGWSSRSII